MTNTTALFAIALLLWLLFISSVFIVIALRDIWISTARIADYLDDDSNEHTFRLDDWQKHQDSTNERVP